MQTIDLTGYEPIQTQGHTSKGNQPKWHIGNIWYKADHRGYEALAEVLVSWMLNLSTISDFVRYEPIVITHAGKTYVGCKSESFQPEHEQLVPLERLHRIHHGIGLADAIAKIPEVEDRIQYTVSFVEGTTDVTNFGFYISTLLELDALILNEDRHTNNLAVLRNENTGTFRPCPIFDNGLSLLSDLEDYPISKDVYSCIGAVESKPFSTDFAEQAEAASRLYGSCTMFAFTKEQFRQKLWELDEYYSQDI